jgi:hypothetical protein
MKKALIIGINAYPTAPLQGQVNDANAWNSTLLNKGFTNSVILDSGSTKAAIMSGLDWLFTGAHSGDSLVFCFGGHGSRLSDGSGDEADQYDEILCPVDFPAQYINDDEIRAKFGALPAGVTLDVFMSTCYSGTSTRAPAPILKMTTVVPGLNHCLWAACKDSQTSIEVTVNGVKRSLFGYYAEKAIRLYSNYYSRATLITSIQNAVKAVNPNQEPQLECTQAESAQKPFT